MYFFSSAILEMITFSPEPHKLFSTTGCKRIKNLVTSESSSEVNQHLDL